MIHRPGRSPGQKPREVLGSIAGRTPHADGVAETGPSSRHSRAGATVGLRPHGCRRWRCGRAGPRGTRQDRAGGTRFTRLHRARSHRRRVHRRHFLGHHRHHRSPNPLATTGSSRHAPTHHLPGSATGTSSRRLSPGWPWGHILGAPYGRRFWNDQQEATGHQACRRSECSGRPNVPAVLTATSTRPSRLSYGRRSSPLTCLRTSSASEPFAVRIRLEVVDCRSGPGIRDAP